MNVAATLLLLIAAAIHGHSPETGKAADAGRELDIRQGQQVYLSRERLRVRFISVLEDSRCPTGEQCIWQGNAKITLGLSKPGGKPTSVTLNTAVEPMSVEYRGYTFKLAALNPYPNLKKGNKRGGYVATLSIAKESPARGAEKY